LQYFAKSTKNSSIQWNLYRYAAEFGHFQKKMTEKVRSSFTNSHKNILLANSAVKAPLAILEKIRVPKQ
jgi:hypothetical protein